MNRWTTHSGTPVEAIKEGRRVQLVYGDRQTGTVQAVDTAGGMLWIWWDGKPRPGRGPMEATNAANIDPVRTQ